MERTRPGHKETGGVPKLKRNKRGHSKGKRKKKKKGRNSKGPRGTIEYQTPREKKKDTQNHKSGQ